MPIQLVLADNHPILLRGLKSLFSPENDFEVVACCESGCEVIEAIRTHKPDVAILDTCLQDMQGMSLVRKIRKEQLLLNLVLFTAELKDEEMIEAIQLNVSGIVLKSMPSQLLLQCVRTVHQGGQWIERQTATRALEKMMRQEAEARKLSSQLTAREIEMIRMVAHGMRNKIIAEKLFISEGTVKVHLHNIYEKLNLDSRMELLKYAHEKGLVLPA